MNKSDTEYLTIAAQRFREIRTLEQPDGSLLYSVKIGVWRADIREAVDDFED